MKLTSDGTLQALLSEWKNKTRITNVQVTPSKAGAGEACLVLIYPPGLSLGRRWSLIGNEIVVGRGGDCDVQIDRDSVSRRHARVYRAGREQWYVEDLGSTNGSYINDVPVQRSPLEDGDFVKIGSSIFKFLSGTGIETSYHEEIYKMTIIDGLTGAHNKRYFIEFLEREIARCSRYGRPLSLLMFDVDHFKVVNDTHGHLSGDHVLKELCKRLLVRIRKEELLARYGGEEFACVLPETDHHGAIDFAEQIRNLVNDEPFVHEENSFSVTISVGVATLHADSGDVATDPMKLIQLADENLYAAKNAGRNRVVG